MVATLGKFGEWSVGDVVSSSAVSQKWGAAVFDVVCLTMPMANDPQDNVDLVSDDELPEGSLDDVAWIQRFPQKGWHLK